MHCPLPHLQAGTTYQIAVLAVNDNGQGPSSSVFLTMPGGACTPGG
jgi:hypothetical protein